MKVKRIFRHRSHFLVPGYSPIILIAILAILSLCYGYPEIATLRPRGIHQWRQCDSLSLTTNLYTGESTFFKTKVNNLLRDNEGRTISEFPLLYYIVSLIWKIFGKHEWLFRAFNLLISFLGMFSMLRLFEHYLKDTFWSLFSVSLLFTSAIFVYYSFNFLPNTTAFSLALIGWYFFFRSTWQHSIVMLWFSIFLFGLAGLLKISSLMNLLALGGLFLLEWSGLIWSGKNQRLFPKKWAFLIPYLIVGLIIGLWVEYVKAYNSTWNRGIFLLNIVPMWDLPKPEIREVFHFIWDRWINGYYLFLTQLLFLAALLFILRYARKVKPYFLAITGFLCIAFLAFFFLFFAALKQHDYYVIDLLMLSVFIMLTLFQFLSHQEKWSKRLDYTWLKILAIGFLAYNVSHTREQVNWRYHNNENMTEFYGYEDIEPVLDSLGIDDSAKFLSPSDRSPNITLYLMNRRGWSGYGTRMEDSAMVAKRIESGARYLVFHKDLDMEKNSHWQYFIADTLAQHKNVKICSLRSPDS